MPALEKIYALCVLALMLMTIVLPFVFGAPHLTTLCFILPRAVSNAPLFTSDLLPLLRTVNP